MATEFEDVLADVGSFGKYQKLMVALVMMPSAFFVAFSVSTLIFQTVVPGQYWCNPPGRESTNYTAEQWWNLTVPRLENGEFEKCSSYHVETRDGEYVSTNSSVTIECSSDWEHDHVFHETMATSMNWLCDKEIYSTHILSINMVGNAVGTLLLPMLADKFTGRRIMFFAAAGIHLVFNLLILVVPFYSVVLAARFLAGLSYQTNFQMPYLIGLELTSPDKRAIVAFFSFLAWTMGMCAASLVAWLVPHWWYLIVITCVTSVIFLCYWSFLPESPRWLLSKGRITECTDMLLKIAATNNKKQVQRKALEKQLSSLRINEQNIQFKELFRHRRLLMNCFLVTCLSFTVFVNYGCTLLNVKILPSNYFLSFFVLSLSELPSNILAYLSVHYLGRRFTAIITSIWAIGFCFLATFSLENRVALLVIVALIKMAVAQGVYLIYVITSEVFPTPIRSTGIGIAIVSGMLGQMFASYIIALSAGGTLQYWVMIGVATAGLMISMSLPETIGLPLPQTFHEADLIGRKRPHWKWIHYWNKHKYEPVPFREV